VRGLAFASNGSCFFSCGSDKTIKQWAVPPQDIAEDDDTAPHFKKPLQSFLGPFGFSDLDTQRNTTCFVTSAASTIDIWDQFRSEPIHSFQWGSDSVTTVKFNPVETHILSSAATDRNIAIYDTRGTPVKKLILKMKTNAICWNPMKAFYFTAATDDHSCYTFDMRKLDIAKSVHVDHVAAVMDIDYSPTGEEFVTGSYDKTVRIFSFNETRSREVYHTKRMQKVFAVKVSVDSKFIFSGSDDTNIRIWKTEASQPLKILLPREEQKLNYSKKLQERYQHLPEIRRIKRHKHLPKSVYSAQKLKVEMKKAEKRKQYRRRTHTKEGKEKIIQEKKKNIVNIVD